jgi:hypothetical protein
MIFCCVEFFSRFSPAIPRPGEQLGEICSFISFMIHKITQPATHPSYFFFFEVAEVLAAGGLLSEAGVGITASPSSYSNPSVCARAAYIALAIMDNTL